LGRRTAGVIRFVDKPFWFRLSIHGPIMPHPTGPPISSIIRQEAMLMATLSFAHDIRAMFRDKDVQEMMDIANFDLSNYADVRAHAADIYERVADGSMPCDGAWSAEQIAKFKQWLDEGMAA
jgi:hypothetical protein